MAKLDQLTTDVELQAAHIRSSIEQYSHITRQLNDLVPRLELVERKTFSLADNPGQRNCPHCTRKVISLRAVNCTHCGKPLHR